jgi:hypothetical protein
MNFIFFMHLTRLAQKKKRIHKKSEQRNPPKFHPILSYRYHTQSYCFFEPCKTPHDFHVHVLSSAYACACPVYALCKETRKKRAKKLHNLLCEMGGNKVYQHTKRKKRKKKKKKKNTQNPKSKEKRREREKEEYEKKRELCGE